MWTARARQSIAEECPDDDNDDDDDDEEAARMPRGLVEGGPIPLICALG